ESAQDDAGLRIEMDLHDTPDEQINVILSDYPRTVKLYVDYHARVAAMPAEAVRIEHILEERYADSEKKDREFRDSAAMETTSGINLYVDMDFLEMVRKIIQDRRSYVKPAMRGSHPQPQKTRELIT